MLRVVEVVAVEVVAVVANDAYDVLRPPAAFRSDVSAYRSRWEAGPAYAMLVRAEVSEMEPAEARKDREVREEEVGERAPPPTSSC